MTHSVSSAPAAVILAAGASTRLGGDPKALLAVGDEPAVVRLVRLARETGHEPIVVVTGAHTEPIAGALASLPDAASVRLVPNDRWEDGRTGSVQVGLRTVPEARDALLWPVDHPFVEASTLVALREAARRDAVGVWFVPSFEGRGGHPVLARAPAFSTVMDLRPDQPLRDVLPRLGPQVCRVPVEDFGVTANVNTPDEYAEAHARWRGRSSSL